MRRMQSTFFSGALITFEMTASAITIGFKKKPLQYIKISKNLRKKAVKHYEVVQYSLISLLKQKISFFTMLFLLYVTLVTTSTNPPQKTMVS